MSNLFYPLQTDYIEKLNTLATAGSLTDGTVNASFLTLLVAGLITADSGLQLDSQAASPSTPATGLTLFADATHIFGWRGRNGFDTKLSSVSHTGSRTLVLPNASTTLAGLSVTQTFTTAQTISINTATAALTLTQAGAGASLTANKQIVSTLATGTAPSASRAPRWLLT